METILVNKVKEAGEAHRSSDAGSKLSSRTNHSKTPKDPGTRTQKLLKTATNFTESIKSKLVEVKKIDDASDEDESPKA